MKPTRRLPKTGLPDDSWLYGNPEQFTEGKYTVACSWCDSKWRRIDTKQGWQFVRCPQCDVGR